MNTDKIILTGERTDQGAMDRAIEIAREMKDQGLWDGKEDILIDDAYAIHQKVFGLDKMPLHWLHYEDVPYLVVSLFDLSPYTQPLHELRYEQFVVLGTALKNHLEALAERAEPISAAFEAQMSYLSHRIDELNDEQKKLSALNRTAKHASPQHKQAISDQLDQCVAELETQKQTRLDMTIERDKIKGRRTTAIIDFLLVNRDMLENWVHFPSSILGNGPLYELNTLPSIHQAAVRNAFRDESIASSIPEANLLHYGHIKPEPAEAPEPQEVLPEEPVEVKHPIVLSDAVNSDSVELVLNSGHVYISGQTARRRLYFQINSSGDETTPDKIVHFSIDGNSMGKLRELIDLMLPPCSANNDAPNVDVNRFMEA